MLCESLSPQRERWGVEKAGLTNHSNSLLPCRSCHWPQRLVEYQVPTFEVTVGLRLHSQVFLCEIGRAYIWPISICRPNWWEAQASPRLSQTHNCRAGSHEYGRLCQLQFGWSSLQGQPNPAALQSACLPWPLTAVPDQAGPQRTSQPAQREQAATPLLLV